MKPIKKSASMPRSNIGDWPMIPRCKSMKLQKNSKLKQKKEYYNQIDIDLD